MGVGAFVVGVSTDLAPFHPLDPCSLPFEINESVWKLLSCSRKNNFPFSVGKTSHSGGGEWKLQKTVDLISQPIV